MIKIKSTFKKVCNSSEKFADRMSIVFGHPLFLLGNLVFWGLWIGLKAEAYPFGELTLFVSLEAIVMSILILNSSNRKGNEDTKLMIEDIEISQNVQETVDDIQSDIDDIHDHLSELKLMLKDE